MSGPNEQLREAAQYTLHIHTEKEPITLKVVSFEGREDLTGLYAFELRLLALSALPGSLLGARATLLLEPTRHQTRRITGLLSSLTEVAASARDGTVVYRARLVPRAALLEQRARSKVFQDKTVPEIIALVAGAAEVPCRANLTHAHERRAYCVQYEETDYAFISRLAGEEGIFWFFESNGEGDAEDERLVLVDDVTQCPWSGDAETALHLRSGGTEVSTGAEGDISSFRLRQSLRPTALLLRDYDFRRPLFDVRAEARVTESETGLLVYDHTGCYEAPDVSERRVQVELEQRQSGARTASGRGTCLELRAGHRFKLESEVTASLSGEYVVTRIRHEGRASDLAGGKLTYSNRFHCVPAAVQPRPKRPMRKLHNVVASAVVVGPHNEEIHTDDYGRVKIQFHWDLDGRMDDKSSIWVRVAQTWAGTGWGTQFVPRVGMEVLVSFLHGDQDCPVVVSCLPNTTHPLPFSLPQNKTRSGIRTQTSPGGAGFNELSFDDAATKERIYLHAQRDLEEFVNNDTRRIVGGNEELETRGRLIQKIGGNVELEITGNRGARVEGAVTEEVHGLHTIIDGAVVHTVARDADLRVDGARTTRVSGDQRSEVGGKDERTIAGDTIEHTKGSRALIVGESGAPKSFVLHVEGTSSLHASDELVLESAKAITLRVGKTTLRISEHGVELVGPSISATAKGAALSAGEQGLSLTSKTSADISADRVLIHTTDEDTILAMHKEVKVSGQKILLNSPEDATDPRPPTPPDKTTIELSDQKGAPIPHQHFILRLDDKTERTGVVDERGRAELVLDPEPTRATIVFPDLPEPHPDLSKEMVAHVVRAGEYLDKLAARVGLEPDTLWNHPKNAELAKKRANPSLLSSGDVIFIPAKKPHKPESIQPGTKNSISRRVPRVPVRVHLSKADGTPLVNEDCEVKSLGIKTKTDGDALLELEVPVYAREVQIWIPSLGLVQPLMVGDLDPVDTPAGLIQRLQNLGYGNYHGFNEEPGTAIRAFQRDHGLETTGVADASLRQALAAAHDHTKDGG
ncbi:MAG: type VI secretion system tip protein TssI/VgrG [Polyangiaceae bacterium]